MDNSDLDPSILDADTLSSIGTSSQKTIVTFDNIVSFKNPVGLDFLRAEGCGDAHQLLSTSSINDSQLDAILRHAFQ